MIIKKFELRVRTWLCLRGYVNLVNLRQIFVLDEFCQEQNHGLMERQLCFGLSDQTDSGLVLSCLNSFHQVRYGTLHQTLARYHFDTN